jgi:hypothetical protein
MKREQSQNCSVPSRPFQKVPLLIRVEQKSVVKLFVEEGIKEMDIIDRLNHHYGPDALQRMHVYHPIKGVTLGRKDISNVSPPGRASDKRLDDCITKALRESHNLSARNIARASNINSTTVRNHLTESWGRNTAMCNGSLTRQLRHRKPNVRR